MVVRQFFGLLGLVGLQLTLIVTRAYTLVGEVWMEMIQPETSNFPTSTQVSFWRWSHLKMLSMNSGLRMGPLVSADF
jgi:hypothetical protein